MTVAGQPVFTEEWTYSFTQKIPFARSPTEPTMTSGRTPDIESMHVLNNNVNSWIRPPLWQTPIPGTGRVGGAGDRGTLTVPDILLRMQNNWEPCPAILGPGQACVTLDPFLFNTVEGVGGQGQNTVIPPSSPNFPVIVADTMNGRNLIVFFPHFRNFDLPGMAGSRDAHFGGEFGRYIRFQIDGNRAQSVRGSGHHVPAIAQHLLEAIDYSMTWNASPQSTFRDGGALRIPTEIVTTFGSDNVTFVGPMVVAILDQFSWIGNHSMSYWTMSNTQIVESPTYYVYAYAWVNLTTGNVRRIVHPTVTGGPRPQASDFPGETTTTFVDRHGTPPGYLVGYVPLLYYSLCDPNPLPWNTVDLTDGGLRRFMVVTGMVGATNAIQQFSTQEAAAIFGAYPDLAFADICS
jgi:hypothetical protein